MSTPNKQHNLSRLLFVVDEEGRRLGIDTTNMLRSINTVQDQLLGYIDIPIAHSELDPLYIENEDINPRFINPHEETPITFDAVFVGEEPIQAEARVPSPTGSGFRRRKRKPWQ